MMIGIDVPHRSAARWLFVPFAVLTSKMAHTLSISFGCLAVQAVKQTTVTIREPKTLIDRVLIALHRFEAKRPTAQADPIMHHYLQRGTGTLKLLSPS